MKKNNTIGFFVSLGMFIWTFTIFINSMDSGESWRIIFSGIGTAIFFGFAVLLTYLRFKKVKEAQAKSDSSGA